MKTCFESPRALLKNCNVVIELIGGTKYSYFRNYLRKSWNELKHPNIQKNSIKVFY